MEVKIFKKDFFYNCLLLMAVTVVMLGFLELALRLRQPAEYIADPYLQMRPRPGMFQRDANGYKNFGARQSAGFVALGNSLTEGINATAAETWPQIVGQEIATTTYNFGAQGYGPMQYVYLFDRAADLHPTTVAVGFFSGSDLLNAYDVVYYGHNWAQYKNPQFDAIGLRPGVDAAEKRLVAVSGYTLGSWKFKLFAARTWLRAHWRTYALLGDATRVMREKLHIVSSEQEVANRINAVAVTDPGSAYDFQRGNISTVLSARYRFDAVDLNNPATAEGWRITQQTFLDLQAKASVKKIRLVVALIPTKELVYLNYLQNTDGKVPDGFGEYFKKETILVERMKAFCAAKKLECVDVLPGLVAGISRGGKLYGESTDGHPYPSGYKIIGDEVAAFLKKSL